MKAEWAESVDNLHRGGAGEGVRRGKRMLGRVLGLAAIERKKAHEIEKKKKKHNGETRTLRFPYEIAVLIAWRKHEWMR